MTNGSYLPNKKYSSTTLNGLWTDIVKFNNKHFHGWRSSVPSEIYAKAADLSTETGEVLDAAKHFCGRGTNPALLYNVPVTNIIEECFDTFVYLVLLIESLGYDRDMFLRASSRKLETLYERMGEPHVKTE